MNKTEKIYTLWKIHIKKLQNTGNYHKHDVRAMVPQISPNTT